MLIIIIYLFVVVFWGFVCGIQQEFSKYVLYSCMDGYLIVLLNLEDYFLKEGERNEVVNKKEIYVESKWIRDNIRNYRF